MGDAPKVVIFGAGITGLTAAHELVERGWDVTVVEKEIDPLNIDEVAIGGLAKTQWAVYQAREAAIDRSRDLQRRRSEANSAMSGVQAVLKEAIAARKKFDAENHKAEPDRPALARLAEVAAGRAKEAAANAEYVASQLREYKEGSNIQSPVEARPFVPTARVRLKSPDALKGNDWDVTDWAPHAEPPGDDVKDALRTAGFKDKNIELNIRRLSKKLNSVLDEGSAYYLARVGGRVRSLRPYLPRLRVMAKKDAKGAEIDPTHRRLAEWLRLYLRACGADNVDITPADTPLPDGVWQIETDLRDRTSSQPLPDRPEDLSGLLPGEHGFRFFPAFYRHLFDTLRRIPVRGEGQSFADAYRTVYDNLIPTEANWLSVTKTRDRPRSKAARERGVVRFPRRLRKSLREVLGAMNDLEIELGYTARDVELLKLRLFKYMTSCSKRRNEQYEAMSWFEFMGLSDLSHIARQDMIRAPQLLAAMTAEESDARTQGNVGTQLLLDPINADERVDSTLNGPTSIAWFLPWKDYLISQGVCFLPGRLIGFECRKEGGELGIRPKMDDDPAFGRLSTRLAKADYYVLALPIQAWSEKTGRKTLWEAWVEQAKRVWEDSLSRLVSSQRESAGDFHDHIQRLGDWIQDKVKPDERGFGSLYKGLSGIQLYFDADRLSRSGHTLFMDSTWRLSSISQASFWSRRRDTFDGYRGIVSVDIGALEASYQPPDGQDPITSFWRTPRYEVHDLVWMQIQSGYGDFRFADTELRPYRMYHMDEYIQRGFREPRRERRSGPLNRRNWLISGAGTSAEA